MAGWAWMRKDAFEPPIPLVLLAFALCLSGPADAVETPDLSSLPSVESSMAASWRLFVQTPLPVNVVINGEAADEPCLITVREGASSSHPPRRTRRQFGNYDPSGSSPTDASGTVTVAIR